MKKMNRIISVIALLSILLCLLPSCGEKEATQKASPGAVGAMMYVGDTNKQGYLITLEGTKLKYETKLALTQENFEAKKTFIETFGKEDAEFEVDAKVLQEFYKNLETVVSSWQQNYTPADGTKVRQYWFVDIYYADGTCRNFTGTEAWPENYSEYIKLAQQLCGKLFPEKIDAYMPEDIAAEQGAAQ